MGSHRLLLGVLGIFLLLTGCLPLAARSGAPAASSARSTPAQTGESTSPAIILQEKRFAGGQIMLQSWVDSTGATCLAATYITPINNEWRIHDTLTGGCTHGEQLAAAYTGNSQINALVGPPRFTTVYGRSETGQAVRIIWSDGQVNHVPLENHSFLEMRSGRWDVERIELLDWDHTLLHATDWQAERVERTN